MASLTCRAAAAGLRLDLVAGRPRQRRARPVRQVLGESLEVGLGVVAEDEADRGRRPSGREWSVWEKSVSPRSRTLRKPPPAAATRRGRPRRRRPRARAGCRAVDQDEDLAGVGQGDDQRVVAPGAVVGDVHALLALAGGAHQGAVHVDRGAVEEGARLLAQTFRRVSLMMSCSVRCGRRRSGGRSRRRWSGRGCGGRRGRRGSSRRCGGVRCPASRCRHRAGCRRC